MKTGLSLSSSLRIAASGGFILAGTIYLIEGFQEHGLIERQLSWAGVTAALFLLGLLALRYLRDPASARAFLGLAAATMPVHFAQLGATTLALQQGTASVLELAIAGGATALLALPFALGIAALGRGEAKRLTVAFYLLSLPLLVPTRDGSLIAGLAALVTGLWIWLEHGVFRGRPLYATAEGIALRVLLASPGVILLLRNAYYPTTSAWLSALFALPALTLLSYVPALTGRSRDLAASIGALALAAAGAILAPSPDVLCLPYALLALPFSVILGKRAATLFALVGQLALLAGAFIHCLTPTVGGALLLGLTAAGHAALGYRDRRLARTLFAAFAGTLGLLIPALSGLHFRLPSLWLPALIASVTLLVLASLLDRHRLVLTQALAHLQNHFEKDR